MFPTQLTPLGRAWWGGGVGQKGSSQGAEADVTDLKEENPFPHSSLFPSLTFGEVTGDFGEGCLETGSSGFL